MLLAVSLYQPWAWLVVLGHKRFETRSWPTRTRGWVAIHAAGGTIPKSGRVLMESDYYQPIADYTGVTNGNATCGPTGRMPTRAIVGLVRIVTTAPVEVLQAEGAITFKEEAFGDYSAGRHGWQLEAPIKLHTPVPCPGHQRFWHVPPDVHQLVLLELKSGNHTADKLPDDLAVAVEASGV